MENGIRKFVSNMKETARKTKAKAIFALSGVIVGGMPLSAYAIDTSGANWNGSSDVNTLISSIIGMVLGLAQGIGIILLIFGVFRLILASKDGNSNEQAQGIQLALVGGMLVGLRALLKTAGLIS